LQRFGRERPIFGTCAGAILLAIDVLKPPQRSLGLVDITVERNGYGRQLDSRIVRLPWEGDDLEAVFIRAPIIRRTGPHVNILASWRDTPVLVEQGRHLVATFHPELSDGTLVHKLFVRKLHS
jgi:5'-phosphate synthase pdxT subunit